jgi:hypothetical protein
MSADADVVGRIEEGGIDGSVADHLPQKRGIATVTAADAVVADDPDVAGLAPGLARHGRNDVVVRILLAPEQEIELPSGEARDCKIHVEIESGELGKLHL